MIDVTDYQNVPAIFIECMDFLGQSMDYLTEQVAAKMMNSVDAL